MTGIWFDGGNGWAPLPAQGFPLEKNLHDCIERAPAMLPLPGQPRLAVLGREVQCGNGYADLIAVDAVTAQPVIIEVKLEKNSDRRSVIAQVLGYAAFFHRMSVEAFEQVLGPHIAKLGHESVSTAAAAAMQDGTVDHLAFMGALGFALNEGRFRCVVVIDSAPTDLVELVDYMQTATNDLLTIDLVTVTKYTVGTQDLLVPQLVEPARREIQAMPTKQQTTAQRVPGAQVFLDAIPHADPRHQHELQKLTDWAVQLESEGLAKLQSVTGKGRWVLNILLPAQDRGLLSLWNERKPYLQMWRSVFDAEAVHTRDRIDAALPGELGQGKYIKSPITEDVLALLRDAYVEASAITATNNDN